MADEKILQMVHKKGGVSFRWYPKVKPEGIVGTVPVSKGGTGADNAETARTNLGAAAASHTHELSGLSGTLPVSKGGTGGTDAETARNNLGAASASHTHELSGLSGTLPVSKGGTGATDVVGARTALNIGSTLEEISSEGNLTNRAWTDMYVYTVPSDGIYMISYALQVTNNSTGARGSRIANDADVAYDSTVGMVGAPNAWAGVQVGAILAVAAGDKLHIQGYQNSGSALTATLTGTILKIG